MNILVSGFTRRCFLRTLGGAIVASAPGPLFATPGRTVTISILHTTDLHGHILPTTDYANNPDLGGLARCATQIRQWRQANPNSILIDIGDVYQGTEIGLRTQGATLIRCLNAINYDAWVVGNHEFDWGMDPFLNSLKLSSMPVLSGNALVEGKPVGTLPESAGPLSRLKPWLVKDVAGIRIVFIALTTPALSTWIPPENMTGFEALSPLESLGKLLHKAKSLKPNAIVLLGHMGLIRQDDYANQVGALTRQFPELAVFIGGHTHQNHSSEIINHVLYTQADHFGIYAGKVDLTFDSTTHRLLKREAVTVHMDNTIAPDPLVLSIAKPDLDAADLVLSRPIGDLTEIFNVTSGLGQPSDVERLIGSAIRASLRKQGCEVDAVVHGVFDNKRPLMAGPKTVADAWNILPYENQIVTIDLSRDDFLALASECILAPEPRGVMGVRADIEMVNGVNRISNLYTPTGALLPAKPTFRIALNSYDSQSAGQRFPTVGQLVARPSSQRVLHPIQIRDALIDFFVSNGKVDRASLLI